MRPTRSGRSRVSAAAREARAAKILPVRCAQGMRFAQDDNQQVLRVDFARQPATTPDAGGREAEFRFSVPVLRVRNVDLTVAWYRRHLGFTAATFPERAPRDFAILGRDGVQLLVRRTGEPDARRDVVDHDGWDLYIWVDGADFDRLEAAAAAVDAVVKPRRTMGTHIAELEVRDPDGYVICIGGPVRAAVVRGA